MEAIIEIILKFGWELFTGGLVLGLRWIEKRLLINSFLSKLKEVRTKRYSEFQFAPFLLFRIRERKQT